MSSRKRAPRLPGHRLLRRTTSRMDAFSDGVFAIAITILVLEISVPEGSSDDLLQAILDQWPSYLAYVVSFATIGARYRARLEELWSDRASTAARLRWRADRSPVGSPPSAVLIEELRSPRD